MRHGDGGASSGAYQASVDGRWMEYDFSEYVGTLWVASTVVKAPLLEVHAHSSHKVSR